MSTLVSKKKVKRAKPPPPPPFPLPALRSSRARQCSEGPGLGRGRVPWPRGDLVLVEVGLVLDLAVARHDAVLAHGRPLEGAAAAAQQAGTLRWGASACVVRVKEGLVRGGDVCGAAAARAARRTIFCVT